jgi:hypothetical protein
VRKEKKVTRDSPAFRDWLAALGLQVFQVKEDKKVLKEKRYVTYQVILMFCCPCISVYLS